MRKFIKTSIREFLNEQNSNKFSLNMKIIDDEYFITATINHTIIGKLTFIKSEYKPNLISTSVVVNPNYRRIGVATAMYDFAEKN